MSATAPLCEYRSLFAGLDETMTPLLDGTQRPYVNLDNAATTPPLNAVLERVNALAKWYASVHRGTGYKSVVSTHVFEQCRETVASFFGMDPDYHTLTFCGNATDAINRLACRYANPDDDSVILTTVLEHHSNQLPWRKGCKVDYVKARFPCGMLDFDDLRKKLIFYEGRVKVVAVTGASNITGLVMPVHEIAKLAHEHGARILVDAAQLSAHHPICMGRPDSPGHIDFLAFSSHKMYAPFGSGGLIGPREVFDSSEPVVVGGGAVDLVTLDDVQWAEAPDREEAGTPNLFGIYALACAVSTLDGIGMEAIFQHERSLASYAIDRLKSIKEVKIFGGCDLINNVDRLGVIPFQSSRYNHALLAAILGHEWGIGVRNGCFCAHPYVEHLLEIDDEQIRRHFNDVRDGNRIGLPGFVRVSLGLYNTERDIDYLIEALQSIHTDGPAGTYLPNEKTGEYHPEDYEWPMPDGI